MDDSANYLPDRDLYSDVVEHGGLVRAIDFIAREHGVDLGTVLTGPKGEKYVHAEISSSRGEIRINIASKVRYFSMAISEANHEWAAGASSDLLDVVRVADSWRRGIGVADLALKYPFMRPGHLAAEYEGGDPVAAQWLQLLADPDLSDIRPLLEAAQSNRKLRLLFPYISHNTLLRMSRNHEDRAAGEVWITQGKDSFRVEDPLTESKVSVNTAHEAVAIAESLV